MILQNSTVKSSSFAKKYIILPVILVAAIVVTSIFTTQTSSVLQSVKGRALSISLNSEQTQEQLQTKTSLTLLSEQISVMSFSKSNTLYVKGVNALALR